MFHCSQLVADNKYFIFFLHSSMGLFTSLASSFHVSCLFILLKCNGWFGSYIISFCSYTSMNSMTPSWVHSIFNTEWQKLYNTKDFHPSSQENHEEWKDGRGADGSVQDMVHVHTC